MLQALGACEGLWALQSFDSRAFHTVHLGLNAKYASLGYWFALFQYWYFTLQIRFRVLALASFFRPRDEAAVHMS
jgi:hypothetical protein